MRPPDINDYPEWLHEYIRPETKMQREMNRESSCIDELKTMLSIKRIDPFAKVLFYLAVETIQQRFTIWTLYRRLQAAEEEIRDLKRVFKDNGS